MCSGPAIHAGQIQPTLVWRNEDVDKFARRIVAQGVDTCSVCDVSRIKRERADIQEI
jgi:hypothetical protein